MFILLRYIIGFAVLGASIGLLYGYWINQMQYYGLLGILIGMIGGLLIGYLASVFRAAQYAFDFSRQVNTRYKLVRCAWCGKTGRTFFLFPCPVCGGRGAVFAVSTGYKCAWCRGTGREMGLLRCRVCDGCGWAYGHRDRM